MSYPVGNYECDCTCLELEAQYQIALAGAIDQQTASAIDKAYLAALLACAAEHAGVNFENQRVGLAAIGGA